MYNYNIQNMPLNSDIIHFNKLQIKYMKTESTFDTFYIVHLVVFVLKHCRHEQIGTTHRKHAVLQSPAVSG